MTDFSSIHEPVRALALQRFKEETPTQSAAFPSILSGRHTLVIAPTGTGKMEAALLPLLSKLSSGEYKPITVLYITPLKALNRDMLSRIEWWCRHLGISLSVRHGDTPQSERAKQTKNPPSIMITTPETLNSLLTARILGQHLKNVKYVVVDEVHELVESKRGTQLSLALERLVEKAGEFQRIGLSATVGDAALTARFLAGKRSCSIARADVERGLKLSVECPAYARPDVKLSKSLRMRPSTVARLRRLHELVEAHGSVLTFVNTRSMAELLSSRYAAWDVKNKVRVHHGSLSKEVRVVAEEEFKDGHVKGLFATSSLELGIDIGRVDLVVQYMSPRQVCRLVQRAGRSGHSMAKAPEGVILAQDAEDALESAVIARRALAGDLEPVRIHEMSLDVLAHQLVGLSLEYGRVNVSDAVRIFSRAFPYQSLSKSVVSSVLEQLASERFVFVDGASYKARNAFKYYFSNLSTIPDEQRFFVHDVVSQKNVASLDEAFVAEHLYAGQVFITKGVPWRVLDVGEREVVVEPASDITAAVPDWAGEEIPVPFEVAQEVGALRRAAARSVKALDAYPLSADARGTVISSVREQKKSCFVPDDKHVFLEGFNDVLVLHTHAGTLVNETLGKVLSSLLTSFTGGAISSRVDAYRIVFEFQTGPRPDLIEHYLRSLDADSIRGILVSSLSRSSLFKWKFIHVAKRFGLLSKDADYSRISLRRLIGAVVDSPVADEAMKELFVEKFDVDNAKLFLNRLQSGSTSFSFVSTASPSEFASFARKASDIFLPERAHAEIMEMVRARILDKRVGFKCLNCGHVWYEVVASLADEPRCAECGAKLVTLLGQKDGERVAQLINAYGRRAVIALQAHGVGPEFAARLLKRLRKSEDELINDLVEAERTFARTKRYWS
ncbi:MAG: DEAD/DEAH box helicase [Candidatus Diapherotrites archaeon]|nr:DEAD/DEAH box helicase [Candidatus Diapherotrites archaeon]